MISFIIPYLLHSILVSKPKKIYTTSLSLYLLHNSSTSTAKLPIAKKKRKAIAARLCWITQLLLLVVLDLHVSRLCLRYWKTQNTFTFIDRSNFHSRESIPYRRLYRVGQRYDIFRIPVNTGVPFRVYRYFLYLIYIYIYISCISISKGPYNLFIIFKIINSYLIY